MIDFIYTKKIIMDNKTLEGATVHIDNIEVYTDWYYDQVDAGLADGTKQFNDFCNWVSDSVCEIILTDQAQVDSYITMAYALADKIGCPLSATVATVVDYPE